MIPDEQRQEVSFSSHIKISPLEGDGFIETFNFCHPYPAILETPSSKICQTQFLQLIVCAQPTFPLFSFDRYREGQE